MEFGVAEAVGLRVRACVPDQRRIALHAHDGKDRTGFDVQFNQTVEKGCNIPTRPELCTVTTTGLHANTADSNGSTAAGQALVAQTEILGKQADNAGKAIDLIGGLAQTAVKVAPK